MRKIVYSVFVPAMIFILSACSAMGIEAEIKTVPVEGGGSMCSLLSSPLEGFSNNMTAIARFGEYEIPLIVAGHDPETTLKLIAAWDIPGDGCGTLDAITVTNGKESTIYTCTKMSIYDELVVEFSCQR